MQGTSLILIYEDNRNSGRQGGEIIPKSNREARVDRATGQNRRRGESAETAQKKGGFGQKWSKLFIFSKKIGKPDKQSIDGKSKGCVARAETMQTIRENEKKKKTGGLLIARVSIRGGENWQGSGRGAGKIRRAVLKISKTNRQKEKEGREKNSSPPRALEQRARK